MYLDEAMAGDFYKLREDFLHPFGGLDEFDLDRHLVRNINQTVGMHLVV
jgi:hypothetical protein